MNLTFKMDCELNNEGDWIPEGYTVSIATNIDQTYASKQLSNGFVPVIITKGCRGDYETVTYEPYVEWFSIESFKEDTLLLN